MKNLLFDFNNMNDKAAAVKKAIQAFSRAGASVVSSDVDKTAARRAGITFRNVHFTFADGQKVTMAIKQSGDVFEVKLNDKLIPIRSQDGHAEAIKEVVARMDTGRAAYQKAMARVKVSLPPAARVSRATMIKAKEQRRDDLKVAVTEAKATLQSLQGSGAPAGDDNDMKMKAMAAAESATSERFGETTSAGAMAFYQTNYMAELERLRSAA